MPADFEGCTATVDELDLCDALTLPAKPLMYQSGYLTIKGLSTTETWQPKQKRREKHMKCRMSGMLQLKVLSKTLGDGFRRFTAVVTGREMTRFVK